MKSILAISFLLFCFSVFSQDSTRQGFATYTGETFKIRYPLTWGIDSMGRRGTEIVLYSPKEDSADKFIDNINIKKQYLGVFQLTLEQYDSLSEHQVKNYYTDCKILSSQTFKRNNHRYHKIIYTATLGPFSLVFEQYYIIWKEYAYVLTFMAEEGHYDHFRAIGESILDSFTILK